MTSTPMRHPVAGLDPEIVAAHLPAQRAAIMRVLSLAIPPAASEEPYTGQECIGLGDAWRSLYTLVQASVREHEGNSCLVLGESGCGKSLLVESVIRRVRHESAKLREPTPWVVTLSALLHPTDRQCLAAMAQQLMDQDAIARGDVAETLRDVLEPEADAEANDEQSAEWVASARASRQASGPDSESESDEEAEMPLHALSEPDPTSNAILSTMAATLSHILSLLTSSALSSSHPLVILLDQFDLFTQRPRQALLYCLLDAVQMNSYEPGMLVLGMTSRVDAADFLEKRVKSRFSHRIVHVVPPSFDQYMILARMALSAGASPSSDWGQAWLAEVEHLIQHPTFRACLEGLHDLSGDVRLLYQVLMPPVAALQTGAPTLEPDAFAGVAATQRADPLEALLLDLNVPEMALMITARHLQLREKEPFTFEMCFHELRHFVQRVQRNLNSGASAEHQAPLAIIGLDTLAQRAPMLQAFHTLLDMELLLPEPARLSLTLPSGIASRTGPVTTPYGTLPSLTVIPEFLPVYAQVSAKAILASVESHARADLLGSALVMWAASTGL
ncbi:origin recognition complex subunit 4 [Malassezia caprae]|uniref:Origin recognition complex subunit 4 n=1 Tax=Malassezia caprae TaxID=1381934 RepID=A0AAF0EAM9_9BASI|nr:origin recognition complex subunit 4 [Malassezia caprae]